MEASRNNSDESSVILGLSPYKTVWRLWLEKLQKALPPDLSNNPLVRYGKETEEIARSLFEFEFGEVLFPTCAEYDENPVFRASFDGLTSDGSPVEFKCPGSSVLEEVKNLGLESEAQSITQSRFSISFSYPAVQKAGLSFLTEELRNSLPLRSFEMTL